MKECICHFVKWQIHPFISEGTNHDVESLPQTLVTSVSWIILPQWPWHCVRYIASGQWRILGNAPLFPKTLIANVNHQNINRWINAAIWSQKTVAAYLISKPLLSFSFAWINWTSARILRYRARIIVQVTINRRLRIGRDGHLAQSEAYDLS